MPELVTPVNCKPGKKSKILLLEIISLSSDGSYGNPVPRYLIIRMFTRHGGSVVVEAIIILQASDQRTRGSNDDDSSYGVAVGETGDVYVTGRFKYTVDFDPGPGIDEHVSGSHWNAFLSKFDTNGDHLWACTWGGNEWSHGSAVTVDEGESVYVTGHFNSTVDFNPGPGVDDHSSNGEEDAFLVKFPPDGNW